jgi:hypothetical protein
MFGKEKFNPVEEQESREKNVEKLKEYLEAMAEDLNNESVPVDSECRIDTKAFREIYSNDELKRDEIEVERLKKVYAKEEGLSVEEWEKKKMMKDGERLEMLKTAIFHRNLDSDFIVVRASNFDDIKRKVDNVIVNKKTGNVICAFDEGSPRKGDKYIEKQEEILERDKKGGANLKYGLTFKDGEEKPHLKGLTGLPIFLLALHPSEIQMGMEKFDVDSDYEKKLFKVFITEVDIQIKKMEEESSDINPKLQTQWSDFREFIRERL